MATAKKGKPSLKAQIAKALGVTEKEAEERALRELADSLGLLEKPKQETPAEAHYLPQRLYLLLDGRGLDGRGMPVEVIVAGHGDALDNMSTLADIGVRTVLTRYGQAVGNLVLLESLPVHGVELAGSLVRAAAQQPDSVIRSALAGLVPLIRRIGIAVAVAGVDDAAQADWWRGAGAESARGAVLGPAVAGQEVAALLMREWR